MLTNKQEKAYSFILGEYLGDGHIVKDHRTYRLRIYQDSKYVKVTKEIKRNLGILFPHNKINVLNSRNMNMDIVTVYSNTLPLLFPQHGKGMKHQRKISLHSWQETIVTNYPLDFLRGLLWSDGCRDKNNICSSNGIYKSYPRWSFSNQSLDIKNLFKNTCDILKIRYTIASNDTTINIATRKDVFKIDRFIGSKDDCLLFHYKTNNKKLCEVVYKSKDAKTNYCLCGVKIQSKSKYCVKCSQKAQEKIIWPSITQLQKRLETIPCTLLAEELGVSDNAIRKRIKTHQSN